MFMPATIWVSLGIGIIGGTEWVMSKENQHYFDLLPKMIGLVVIAHGQEVKAATTKLLFFGTPILFFTSLIWWIYRTHADKRISINAVAARYLIKAVAEDQLDEIVNFGHALVGDNHIDVPTLKDRFRINSNILTALYSSGDSPSLLGYFIIYPLNKKGLY